MINRTGTKFSGLMVTSQASPMAQQLAGMSVGLAVTAVSVLALFNAAGRGASPSSECPGGKLCNLFCGDFSNGNLLRLPDGCISRVYGGSVWYKKQQCELWNHVYRFCRGRNPWTHNRQQDCICLWDLYKGLLFCSRPCSGRNYLIGYLSEIE